MEKLTIIAKNEIGSSAIVKHFEESLKMNWAQKTAAKKMGFNQQLTQKEPATLEVWATPHTPFYHVKDKHFKEEVEETLLKNGAKLDIDYYYAGDSK